jgi:hypothetical protein
MAVSRLLREFNPIANPDWYDTNGSRFRPIRFVMAGHSRSKNGIASLAYVPAIHDLVLADASRRGCPRQARA